MKTCDAGFLNDIRNATIRICVGGRHVSLRVQTVACGTAAVYAGDEKTETNRYVVGRPQDGTKQFNKYSDNNKPRQFLYVSCIYEIVCHMGVELRFQHQPQTLGVMLACVGELASCVCCPLGVDVSFDV